MSGETYQGRAIGLWLYCLGVLASTLALPVVVAMIVTIVAIIVAVVAGIAPMLGGAA